MQTIDSRTREKELRSLIGRIEAHPEREWQQERKRIAVLQRLLLAEQVATRSEEVAHA